MVEPALSASVVGQSAADVWARARERHLSRIEVLERAVLALMDGELDEALREVAESEAHSLAGTVGAFGFRAGSRLARALEQSFAARHTLGKNLAARLADQVLALRRELEGAVAPEVLGRTGEEPRRLLLLTDGGRGDQYVTEGVAVGVDVIVRSVEQGVVAVAVEAPDVVVIEGSDAESDRLAFLLSAMARHASCPVLVVSPNDSMALRLAIARCSAVGPLLPGHPPHVVLERAMALVASRERASAVVFVVDSDPYALELSTLVLEQSGHRVHALADPARFWETLETVSPDLLLLGVALPQVSGLDLCRALRADPRWRELPVVFMASAGEADHAKAAYRSGGDDVLRKPLQREDLLARIENRISRARLLRKTADADGLTGLPSRQKAERELERFLRLGRRHRHPVTMTIFRLDGFGALQQRVGQTAMDAAVLAFSQILQQSFRAEDVVSQWGPNEFVVGLFDATAVNAVVRVREVMTSLRTRAFPGGGTSFSLTCSAGLATFPDDAGDARELHGAADAALLVAGGNTGTEVLGIASDPNAINTGRVDVLLIEEDAAIATLLLHALESRQYSVRWLRSGQEATNALLGDRPELRARLILLEVNLPGLDGLSVLRTLGSHDVLRHTRVMILSSRTSEAETVQAFELGAFDYVAKPFSVAVLTERIRRALKP